MARPWTWAGGRFVGDIDHLPLAPRGYDLGYYMAFGDLAGASDAVLEGVARALQLHDAERDHLFDLARASRHFEPPDPVVDAPRRSQFP